MDISGRIPDSGSRHPVCTLRLGPAGGNPNGNFRGPTKLRIEQFSCAIQSHNPIGFAMERPRKPEGHEHGRLAGIERSVALL